MATETDEQLSDEALVERIREGNLAAFDRLYERYERGLFGFVLRHVGNQQDAEDVFHEVFLKVLKVPPEARNFRSWIYQVARNACLNRIRSRAREREAVNGLAQEPILEGETPDEKRAAALARAVARLPTPLAEVYGLRTSGLRYEEIARTLGIPVGTVRSRLHQMIKRLRKEMRSWIAA